MPPNSDQPKNRMPFIRFFVAIGLQLAAILTIYSLVAKHVFAGETAQPWGIVLWTVALGLPLSLFEYLFHRYLLHSAVLPFMASMHRAHTKHHSLTYVRASVTPQEPDRFVKVRSAYPVVEDDQEESMMFPLYSLPIFMAVFLGILGLPLKFLLPHQPVLISLTLAVALYLVLYEVWHAVLHLPFERYWEPLLTGRLTRRPFSRMYSFHLMHHWRPSANLAIVGFWGIAVWDHLFRTHRRPYRLPLDGADVTYEDARLTKPLWPVALLDRWQRGLYKASRALESFLARVFLARES